MSSHPKIFKNSLKTYVVKFFQEPAIASTLPLKSLLPLVSVWSKLPKGNVGGTGEDPHFSNVLGTMFSDPIKFSTQLCTRMTVHIILSCENAVGSIHKPCGHGRGRGVSQMSMLLHKSYLVKWSTKGEGGKNLQKLSTWSMDAP